MSSKSASDSKVAHVAAVSKRVSSTTEKLKQIIEGKAQKAVAAEKRKAQKRKKVADGTQALYTGNVKWKQKLEAVEKQLTEAKEAAKIASARGDRYKALAKAAEVKKKGNGVKAGSIPRPKGALSLQHDMKLSDNEDLYKTICMRPTSFKCIKKSIAKCMDNTKSWVKQPVEDRGKLIRSVHTQQPYLEPFAGDWAAIGIAVEFLSNCVGHKCHAKNPNSLYNVKHCTKLQKTCTCSEGSPPVTPEPPSTCAHSTPVSSRSPSCEAPATPISSHTAPASHDVSASPSSPPVTKCVRHGIDPNAHGNSLNCNTMFVDPDECSQWKSLAPLPEYGDYELE
ncbi:hypothetical protein BOTBODRAFT_43012 [Botryobasidium botryosum FD-172 SS1]|uniref:Uncharacterized protein n=1 Tax=Botryobasidium botryosum (strain FD-172 SS1) TaxID=930990 RepID=A0A067MZS2_BOTB1|nr:hypothetical protein BOTBODRAFT_43012 [Botryobasidium botryosum FD-172 SS1]